MRNGDVVLAWRGACGLQGSKTETFHSGEFSLDMKFREV